MKTKKKFLLAAVNAKYIHSNPAVHSLKAYGERELKNMGLAGNYNIEIAEYTINQPVEKIIADIYKQKADVLFLSCYIWNISYIKRIVKDLAKIKSDMDIWLGGPEVSFECKSTLSELPYVKGIAKGEGEETFLRIIRSYINEEKIQGINGTIIRNDRGEIEEMADAECMDMSQLPFLYKNLDDLENRIVYYESSRGCPYRCSYCLSSVDKKLRFRSMEQVKRELQFFLDKKVPQVKFIDRTFNCNRERSIEIWEFIKERDNGITNFHFEIAGDILSDDELKLLKELRQGQIQLEIGVQSTNVKTLSEINRPMDFSLLAEKVKALLSQNNIHIHLDLIAGLPYEDYESFGRSFDHVIGLKPHQLQLGFLKVLKGSPMKENSEKYGLKFSGEPPYEVLETRWLSYEDILRLKGIEEMLEVYYNSRQFTESINYLMGYSEGPFKFFEDFAKYHQANSDDMVKLSRNARYKELLDFARESQVLKDEAAKDEFRSRLIMDYYKRDNVKSRPEFLGSETAEKDFLKNFYSLEAREHKYLRGGIYDTDDPRLLRKLTHIEKLGKRYLLFDYSKRDPMENNAHIIEIY